jgi:hypothetical protein
VLLGMGEVADEMGMVSAFVGIGVEMDPPGARVQPSREETINIKATTRRYIILSILYTKHSETGKSFSNEKLSTVFESGLSGLGSSASKLIDDPLQFFIPGILFVSLPRSYRFPNILLYSTISLVNLAHPPGINQALNSRFLCS